MAKIRINIGIMAEEIAVVLQAALTDQKKASRPQESLPRSYTKRQVSFTAVQDNNAPAKKEQGSILVISRGDISKELFERRLCTYDGLGSWDELAATDTVRANLESQPSTLCNTLALKMQEKFTSYPSAYFTIPGAKHKTKEITKDGVPTISIGRIGNGPVRSIFIQSPEMGFQSNLCEQYLTIIHDALSETLHFNQPGLQDAQQCEIVSFGGGGSTYAASNPGERDAFNHVLSVRTYVDIFPMIQNLKIKLDGLEDQTETTKICREALAHLEQVYTNYSESKIITTIDAIREIYRWGNTPEQTNDLFTISDKEKQYYSKIEIMGTNGSSEVLYRSPPCSNYRIAQEKARVALSLLNHTDIMSTIPSDLRELQDKEIVGQLKACPRPVLQHAFHKDYFDAYVKNKTEIDIGAEEKLILDSAYQTIDTQYEEVKSRLQNLVKEIEQSNVQLQKAPEEEKDALRKHLKTLVADKLLVLKEYTRIKEKIDSRNHEIRKLLASAVASQVLGGRRVREERLYSDAKEHMEKKLKDFFKSQVEGQENVNIQTSLDISFFGGVDEKVAFASAINACCKGLTKDQVINETNVTANKPASDVNMEDALVAKTFGHTGHLKITRVHCDPSDIDDNMKKNFATWQTERKEQGCTLDYYVSAVQWGIEGYKMDDLLASKNPGYEWTLPQKFTKHEQESIFYRGRKNEPWIVMDPFWREISTDLLRDISTGAAFSPDVDGIAKKQLTEKAAIFYQKILESPEPKLSEADKQALQEILKSFLELNLAIAGKPDRFKTWVRKKAWIGNEENTLEAMDTFSGTRIDRAFYVSNNFPALSRFAERAAHESFDKMQPRVSHTHSSSTLPPLENPAAPQVKVEHFTREMAIKQIMEDHFKTNALQPSSENRTLPSTKQNPAPIVLPRSKQNLAPYAVAIVALTVVPIALAIALSNPLFLIGLGLALIALAILYIRHSKPSTAVSTKTQRGATSTSLFSTSKDQRQSNSDITPSSNPDLSTGG